MAYQKDKKNIVNDAIVKDISDAIHNLKYGTVTIMVHNSRIVQAEVTEKKRFDDIWLVEGGGGI
ncbi:MAG: YezD family protein [Candidatus Omnitrophota bacterium]